jgi:hypothetical protein
MSAGLIARALVAEWQKMRQRRLLLGVALIVLGLVFWLLIGPGIIGLGGETGSFVSFMSWLGISATMFGIGLFVYGVGELV